MLSLLNEIKLYLRNIFNFSHELADQLETIRSIEKGVEFRGINVWTLIFAIFVASIGLNVNSTAVIIGAMLISPLMGPIMGLGMSVGTYDFDLLKKSFRNLVIAVIISVVTSSLYFLISPLNEAQSELLARTTPTIYDVLIALFGGLAGIVAGASKEKGNAIPGVAIATALMPPLCTAGFGLATGNWMYFFGAFYLFFINAVMISLSTFLMVRFLKFPFKQEIDKARAVKVKRSMLLIITLTVLPSIYFAFSIVGQTVFNAGARKFIANELKSDQWLVLQSDVQYHLRDSNVITVFIAGENLKNDDIRNLKSKLDGYGLKKTRFLVRQASDVEDKDLNLFKKDILETLKLQMKLNNQENDDRNIAAGLRNNLYDVVGLAREVNALNPKVLALNIGVAPGFNVPDLQNDTVDIVLLKVSSGLNQQEVKYLDNWLKIRLKKQQLKIYQEP